MKFYFALLVIIFSLSACETRNCNCDINQAEINRFDSLLNLPKSQKHYKNYWKEHNEPSLLKYNTEVYRYAISATLSDIVKIYRVEKDSLFVKRYHSNGIGVQDSFVYSKAYHISKDQWHMVAKSFEENCFWTMPYSIDRLGLDGAGYTLESYNPKNNGCTQRYYHQVYRWSPPDSTKFYSLCKKIMALEPK